MKNSINKTKGNKKKSRNAGYFLKRKKAQPLKGAKPAKKHKKAVLSEKDLKGREVTPKSTLKESLSTKSQGKVKVAEKGDFVTGIFQDTRKGYGFLCLEQPQKEDIFIPAGKTAGASRGDRVKVRLIHKKRGRRSVEGEVISIVMSSADQLKSLDSFPAKVMKELEDLPGEEDIPEIARREKRPDLRALTIVTIDPETAKDIDDGISLTELPGGGYKLGVHIADVSYYVREKTALFREALKRATSIYLADRVIHMLPPLLSQNLCSLNEGVDRLAFSVIMELDPKGNVTKYDIFPSIIKVKRQLSYEEAAQIIDGEKTDFPGDILKQLPLMNELALILKEKRLKRGALNLNLPETQIILDDAGKPLSIERKKPGRAESIIEEFMLMANETVAGHYSKKKVPFVYRIHPRPTEEKMIFFRKLLAVMGIKVPGDLKKIKPRAIQKILEQVKGKPVERSVNYVLLRSLPQAYYTVQKESHFGLASEAYTHFTSPIRRFPDLQIHALIKLYESEKIDEKELKKLEKKLMTRADHSSRMERTAMEKERESIDEKKIEYMEGKEGEEFQGVVSGVTSFGLFIELENTVEGLVLLEDMEDDYYRFQEELMMVSGRKKHKKYSLGDPVNIKVHKVDPESKTIYFKLI